MSPATPAQKLLNWYDVHRRNLPWRAGPGEVADPYSVWLSEIMLQQTTVAAVKPYFARFLTLWPEVCSLARAPRADILRQWAGLGYYARARNLHDCARAVADRHAGHFPTTEARLRELPGIGDYTAAAIAAIAFGEPAVVVDGNVERVASRLFAIDTPLPKAKPELKAHVAGLVPVGRPGDFAQATMDLGAMLCTPRAPACALCPLSEDCRARAEGTQGDYPRRLPKRPQPRRFGAVAIIERGDGAVLVRTRPSTGLFGGMTEFFGTSWTEVEPELGPLRNLAGPSLRRLGEVEHVFTHFALRLEVYAGCLATRSPPSGWRWVSWDGLAGEAFPTLMRKVLQVAAPERPGARPA